MNDLYEQEAIPVNILWDGVLLVPIVGVLDSERSQNLIESLLETIVRTEARFAILDILGVASVDSAVAAHLIKITRASRLVGCTTIITGISPSVAQSIVQLGIDLGDVVTQGTLRDGLGLAMKGLGFEIRKRRGDSQ